MQDSNWAPKRILLQQSVRFLGHVVNAHGQSTDPKKIEAVRTWPSPQTAKDVESFQVYVLTTDTLALLTLPDPFTGYWGPKRISVDHPVRGCISPAKNLANNSSHFGLPNCWWPVHLKYRRKLHSPWHSTLPSPRGRRAGNWLILVYYLHILLSSLTFMLSFSFLHWSFFRSLPLSPSHPL